MPSVGHISELNYLSDFWDILEKNSFLNFLVAALTEYLNINPDRGQSR